MERNVRFQLIGATLAIMLLCSGCAAPGVGGHTVTSQAYPFYSFAEEEVETDAQEEDTQEEEGAQEEEDSQEQAYTVGRQEVLPEEGDENEESDDSGIYDLTISFLDGNTDIPYLSVSEWTRFMATSYPVEYEASGSKATVTRTDTGYTAIFDADNDTVTFYDFNAFFQRADSEVLVSGTSSSRLPEDNEGEVFSAVEGTYNRNGKEVVFELAPYEIDIVQADGEFLLPMQTLNDFSFSYLGYPIYFDGEGIAVGSDDIYAVTSSLDLPETTLSDKMAAFNYHELCFLLDNFYGLKDTHDIVSFDAFFDEVGLKERLSSTNPKEVEEALHEFISLHLDDIHSSYGSPSPLAGAGYAPQAVADNVRGFSRLTNDVDEERYKNARAAYYPDGIPGYEEVGDTAFITFDEFERDLVDYYSEADLENPQDTIALIAAAHAQITREDSPVKNVVIDLSCNTGGAADAAVYVIGWFLDETPIALRDTLSGGMSLGMYKVDTNLDRSFDKADGLEGRNLYCLISPVSFSCGNLVPAAFKNSGRVTLLGRQSCGGSCIVFYATNAIGSQFTISGCTQCSITKNGSFYNIDEGIAPDFVLNNPNSYYDRERLVEYIHGSI